MKAGEVGPYFDALRADLAQVDDPQIRAWYEMENSLSPEYREAETLQETLGRFGLSLSQLIETKSVPEVSASPEPEVEFDSIDKAIDEDEWLTPEQRKQKSVLAWLSTATEQYRDDIRSAQSQSKASKRQHQLTIAGNRFARRFESFGDTEKHIVYDAEALGYVLDELQPRSPRLAEMVVGSAVEYLQTDSLEFADNHAAFAGLIRASIVDVPRASVFDRLLSAVYEKPNFVAHPEHAARLYVALAHTVFEVTDDSNIDYYHKILDTVYGQNDIIPAPQKAAFVTAIEATVAVRQFRVDPTNQLIADTLNARGTFSQAARAYVDHWTHYYPGFQKHYSADLARQMTKSMILIDSNMSPRTQHEAEDDFFQQPQIYDPFEMFDLDSGEQAQIQYRDNIIPARWREAYTSSDLYKKRTTLLAPRAIVHDLIRSTLQSLIKDDLRISHIVNVPLSPGITLSFAVLLKAENTLQDNLSVGNTIMNQVMEDYVDTFDYERFRPTEQRLFGTSLHFLGHDEKTAGIVGVVIARKSVPEDLKNAEPHTGLSLALRHKILDYSDGERSRDIIEAKKEHIRHNRHNYLGRRPIIFRLTEEYREKGLLSIEMRQHTDHAHVMVTAHHVEGDIPFLFDAHMNYEGEDPRNPLGITMLQLAFEDLVVSLANEWACRPVVETSEGTVRVGDSRSKVNLGFLRYLPPGARASDKQRKIFAREQGGDLAAQSEERRAKDPSGLGKASTYVRETYDSERPPLEIFYDPTAI